MAYDKQSRIVTRDQLINLLSEDAGAAPIGFVARTKVRLNKKHRESGEPNPFGEVVKVARVKGWVNCSYAAAWEKETGEKYVPGQVWHDAALDDQDRLTPFAENPENDKLYLRVLRPHTVEEIYESSTCGFVKHDDLKPFLPPPPKERPVRFKTYGLEGIVAVTFDKQEVVVVDSVVQLQGAA